MLEASARFSMRRRQMKRSRSTVSPSPRLRIVEQHLLDLWARGVGLFAERGDVDRRLPPAVKREAGADDLAFNDDARALLRGEIVARQEELADEDRLFARLVAGALDNLAEEILRRFDQDARAVAGFAVRIDGAAVPYRLERRDRHGDDIAARFAVDGDDEADAACIALIIGRIHAIARQPRGLAAVAFHFEVDAAHHLTPQPRARARRVLAGRRASQALRRDLP